MRRDGEPGVAGDRRRHVAGAKGCPVYRTVQNLGGHSGLLCGKQTDNGLPELEQMHGFLQE